MSGGEPLPAGLVEVGTSGAVAQCTWGRMALRTVEAQNMSLFDAPRPGKMVRFKNVQRLGGGQAKEGGRSGSREEGGGEEVLPRETLLVPAADETVRTTLKPWLRDAWKIMGEISSITEDTDEETAAEILKDVYGNAAGARNAAKHLRSPWLVLQVPREDEGRSFYDAAECEQAKGFFPHCLEDRLKSLNVDRDLIRDAQVVLQKGDEPVGALDAIKTLEVVKDTMLAVLGLPGVAYKQATGSNSIPGLTELHIDLDYYAPVAALVAALTAACKGSNIGPVSLQQLVTMIRQCELVWPRKEEPDGLIELPPWAEDLMHLLDFAAKGIRGPPFGSLSWEFNGSLWMLIADAMGPVAYIPLSGYGLCRNVELLVYGLQQAVACQQNCGPPPRAYLVHPMLNSVTVHPGCALKPFSKGWSTDDCPDKLRRTALRDGHGMLFISGKWFVIILNFKTSNACIVKLSDEALEGASPDAASAKAVHKLLKNEVVEGEMEIDRSQTAQQVSAARDASTAQGRDPGEMAEWEGTAMLAAATWLQSTHLLRVGNCWYIRQNPRWKRIWKLVIKFVRQHRLTGISVLSAGVTWNTVVVRDGKIIKLLCDKMLAATRTAQKGWYEVTGSKDIEGIVRATAGDALHIDDNVLRLCRSTIEGSIAQAEGIILMVYGGFSSWRHLYTQEQRGQDTKLLGFDYVAKDPHQLGGRSLMKLDADDGYYIKLRNDAGVLQQRWYKLRNAPDSPVLDLDGQFKDTENLTEEEHKSADLFDATNRIVSIGAGTLSG